MGIADTVRFGCANECTGIALRSKTTRYHLTINLADYTISFDLTIDSASIPASGFELWIACGAMDFTGGEAIPDDGSNLYPISLAGFTAGVSPTVTVAMDAFHFTPGQYGDPFDLTVDQWHIHLNGLDFGSTAGNTVVHN